MSTPITLTVGSMTLTYNTMHTGIDHGMLFQERDRQRRRHPDINYEYFAKHPELDRTQREWCLCRSLRSMVPRLELLGYTLGAIRVQYSRVVARDLAQLHEDTDAGKPTSTSGGSRPSTAPKPISFDEFIAFVSSQAVSELNNGYEEDDNDHVGSTALEFGNPPGLSRLPEGDPERDRGGYRARRHFASVFDLLNPYSILRVLAENPANLDLDVVWDYGNFVDAGWAKNEDFVTEARRAERYLIATEGSSDTHIIKRAIELLRPEVRDFFQFIDVSERHPFSGTGNLAKFAEGLVKIDVHNQVVLVLDNDAEGLETYLALQKFSFPSNMRAMLLPDMPEFRAFPARGPDGVKDADINGRAAAIECYLDLRLKGHPAAQVHWSNYKKSLDAYQGALEHKESYAQAFFAVREDAIASGQYDVSKLRVLLDALLGECTAIAEKMLLDRTRLA